MSIKLKVEIAIAIDSQLRDQYLEQPVEREVAALRAFLRCLYNLHPQSEFFSMSEVDPPGPPNLVREVVVSDGNQASALGDILSGWAKLSVRKRIIVSAGEKRLEINSETDASERDRFMRGLAGE